MDIIKKIHPEVESVNLQSDNASCFASQENIPFIYHMNDTWTHELTLAILAWLFNEAQTSKGRLDTHFSFVNTFFRAYIED